MVSLYYKNIGICLYDCMGMNIEISSSTVLYPESNVFDKTIEI